MTQKSQKQKPNNQFLYLFQYKNDLLFFKYEQNHPKRIDIEEFYIGKFRLFRKDKIYSSQLKSKPFLNPSLIWNADTFEMMTKKLNDFVIQEEIIDLSQWLFISVYIKIKGKQINLLKIKLTEQFGIDTQNQLWNQFKKYNTFKTNHFCQISNSINSLNQQIQTSLERLQKLQNQQMQKVQEVKKKLSALIYEKEKKIMEITGNHLYKWIPNEQNDEQQFNKKLNKNLHVVKPNWMSSQDDHILIGSLFAPSQDFLH